MIVKCGEVESGIGRIEEPILATIGGNLKQNGIGLGRTTFPKTGRRESTGQRVAKNTLPTSRLKGG